MLLLLLLVGKTRGFLFIFTFFIMSSTGAGYDLDTSCYSPDGRVFQVDYATKASDNSGCAVGLKCKDGVVMGVEKIIKSKLLVEGSNRRIHNIFHHAGIAVAGWDADGRLLAERARDESFAYRADFGIDIPPHELADRLGHYLHAYTCYSSYRPFGVSVLLAGYDPAAKDAFLHMIEPSGLGFRFRGCSVGKARQSVKTEIEKLDLESMTVREGLKQIARIVRIVHDEDKDKAFEFEASWVCEESGWEHRQVPKELRDEADAWAKQRLEMEDVGGGEMQVEGQ
jgi:20S proteasome subunit alpha 7